MSRAPKTALERYEAEGVKWQSEPRNFPVIEDYDNALDFVKYNRERLVRKFADDRRETVKQTIRAIFSHVVERGLTFDELLWHHFYSNWAGGMTTTERQRQAAYKAWKTIRQRKREQEDG